MPSNDLIDAHPSDQRRLNERELEYRKFMVGQEGTTTVELLLGKCMFRAACLTSRLLLTG